MRQSNTLKSALFSNYKHRVLLLTILCNGSLYRRMKDAEIRFAKTRTEGCAKVTDLRVVGVWPRNRGRGVGLRDVRVLRWTSFLLLNEKREHEVGLDRVVPRAQPAGRRLAGEQGSDQRNLVRVCHLLEKTQFGR